MEWIETTAPTVTEAEASLVARLGVSRDEVEFETLEEPRAGLFGRVKGEARVRARLTPKTHATPERRQRPARRDRDRSGTKSGADKGGSRNGSGRAGGSQGGSAGRAEKSDAGQSGAAASAGSPGSRGQEKDGSVGQTADRRSTASTSPAEPAMALSEVADLVDVFLNGLVGAAELDATTDVVETPEGGLEATINGAELGILIGRGGRTLLALQDLCRTLVQRRAIGAEQTRLTLDIGGFNSFRDAELSAFVADVVERVRSTGQPHVFEQMSASDRRLVHEAVADVADVVSSSIGEEPRRQVMLSPAE